MAITLPQIKVSVNLANIVDAAIEVVQTERKKEVARIEAEFQKAVADGLPYEEQIRLREQQVLDEKSSGFEDAEYTAALEKNIADTKKLNRFNKYRTKYAAALGELSAGKINENQYLSTLKNTLSGVDDSELRLEIQNDIATAEGKVKTYNDTILSNQVRKAKYDGTQAALSDAVNRVKNARASALISDNQDEVTAYDETLSALNSQLSTVGIQDSLTDFQVRSSIRGTNPMEKLSFINDEISKANPNQPIRIGNSAYTSAQQFWTLERDNYLNGSSKIFSDGGDFFNELKIHSKNIIDSNTAKFGYPIQTVLDDVSKTLNDLGTRVEMQPYLNKFDVVRAAVMADAVNKTADKIVDIGTTNLQFKEADAQLNKLASRYGVDVTAYRLNLDAQLRNLTNQKIISKAEGAELAPDIEVTLPKIGEGVTPTTPTTPVAPVAGGYTIKAGDTLSVIARQANLSLNQLLDLNPQFKANPNLIKPGQNVALAAPAPVIPETTPKPTITPTPTPTPTPAPTNTPSPSPIVPVAPKTATQQPPVAPVVSTIPKPTSYVIKSGDTLSGIAQKLLGDAARYQELATLNNIKDPNKIIAGATLNLPI